MVFSSLIFLCLFLPSVLLAYFISANRYRNICLLIFSLIFYAWGESQFVFVMLISIAVNYALGIWVDISKGHQTRSKVVIFIAIFFNLSMLVFFKYANFIVDNLNKIDSLMGGRQIHLDPVHLPVGISFFTFHAISYIMDIYRGKSDALRSPFNLGLYITLFPQLIAGPIVRFNDISKQLLSRNSNRSDIAIGIERFIIGLGKKVLIANTLAKTSDSIFGLPISDITVPVTWLGILCYTLQIYFDFSAYSDMAIGLARVFGFRLLENFNFPYISISIQEFWRRWHISLSSWFRDYLYIPLGGNKKGSFRTYINLLIVFFLCGLWHGASWNFIIWGMIHGFFLVLERYCGDFFLEKLWKFLRHVYTMLVVSLAWVFFRVDTISDAVQYFCHAFGFGKLSGSPYGLFDFLDSKIAIVLTVGVIGSIPVYNAVIKFLDHPTRFESASMLGLKSAKLCFLTTLLIASVLSLASGAYNPFIYYRF
jgi:alginate O-acetyltransferase complex protein AlgI